MACVRPTVVVLLPSPSGVGVILRYQEKNMYNFVKILMRLTITSFKKYQPYIMIWVTYDYTISTNKSMA